MSGFVVPIKEFSPLALASVRFAIEFGKRSKGRFFFLFVDDPTAIVPGDGGEGESSEHRDRIKERIETLIVQGKLNDGLQAEIHCRQGDFIQEVRQFVRDYHIDEIVLAVPEGQEQDREQMNRDVQPLLQLTHCRILTVRPKSKGT
ncbi:MAG: universal stress protein [Deltaproteobacteria bacterium]|nr:universal stress protein [Deltaproteobacteria bacterium]